MKNIAILLLFVFCLTSCELFVDIDDTENASETSVYPIFVMEGEEYLVLKQGVDTYSEPGVIASEIEKGSNDLDVIIDGVVDMDTPALYPIIYYATNQFGYKDSIVRYVAVIDEAMLANDISGTYEKGTRTCDIVKTKDVFYHVSDIWGLKDKSLPVDVVLVDAENLAIIPGEFEDSDPNGKLRDVRYWGTGTINSDNSITFDFFIDEGGDYPDEESKTWNLVDN